jgi:hypothetical protein
VDSDKLERKVKQMRDKVGDLDIRDSDVARPRVTMPDGSIESAKGGRAPPKSGWPN